MKGLNMPVEWTCEW